MITKGPDRPARLPHTDASEEGVAKALRSLPAHHRIEEVRDGWTQVLDALAQRERELAAAHRQLQAFAADFRRVRRSERTRLDQLESAQAETALRLLQAARLRDEETGAHIWRVGLYAGLLGRKLNDPIPRDILTRAAPLHDVGKIGVPDAILRKPGKLEEEQWKMMREHTTIGAQVLQGSASPLLQTACRISATHHENFDGSGYPHGLAGEQIPVEGRITKLADTYDALRMQRCYKPAFDHDQATEIILNGDGRTRPAHFDPAVLEAFRDVHLEFDDIYRRFSEDSAIENWPAFLDPYTANANYSACR